MRTIERPAEHMDIADWEALETEYASADWREAPGNVLDTVDDQLADFGLEVVQIETGSDVYRWKIEKRREAP